MNPLEDKLSASIKVATDILFVKNPVGTSMGVLFGIVLHGLSQLLSPALETVRFIKLSTINIFYYIAFGIFGFNLKSFVRPNRIDPQIDAALSFIQREQKAGRITKAQAKLQYQALINRVVQNVQLDQQTQREMDIIESARK